MGEQGTIVGPVPLTPIQRWFFEQELTDAHHFNQARLLQLARLGLCRSGGGGGGGAGGSSRCAPAAICALGGGGWEQTNAAEDEDEPLLCSGSLGGWRQRTTGGRRLTRACAQWQASLDLRQGLCCARLLRLGQGQPARLLLAIHHLVVDGVSWRVLLEDLETGLEQLGRGEAVAFAPQRRPHSSVGRSDLVEYARSASTAGRAGLLAVGGSSGRSRLPVDYPEGRNTSASERAVRVSLSEEETRALLHEVPAVYHTQINDVLLTASGAGALWRGQGSALRWWIWRGMVGRRCLKRWISRGRSGWFTSLYPVRLELAALGRAWASR